MAIANTYFPRELSELHVAALTGETVGSLVRLTAIRQLDLTIATESVELRGDGTVVSTSDQGQSGEFTMEAGGITFAALQVIFGVTFTASGTTPNVTRTLEIKGNQNRPYFYIVGKAFHDDPTQDVHVQVMKAKMTGNYELSFSDGEYVTPSMNGTFIGRASDNSLLRIVEHETAIAPAAPS